MISVGPGKNGCLHDPQTREPWPIKKVSDTGPFGDARFDHPYKVWFGVKGHPVVTVRSILSNLCR